MGVGIAQLAARWVALLGTALAVLLGPSPAARSQAAGPGGFGSGLQLCATPYPPVTLTNPKVVTNCTQAGLQAALSAGGQIRLDCGPAPFTIPLTSQLELSTTTDTVLDGRGLVTLDGQGATRILHKGWHDPVTVGTVNITLQNLRLVNGRAPAGGGTGDHSGGALASGHPGTRLRIINSTFEHNATSDIHTPDNQGGAIFSSNSYETVLSGSVFSGNTAGNGGAMGGIATGLLIYNTRFSGNHALDDAGGGIVRGYGGAIHLDGVTNNYNPNSNRQVLVCGALFEDNTAVRGGGAMGVVVSDARGTKAVYERSVFNRNAVSGRGTSYGQGGAIYHIEDDHAGGLAEDNLEIRDSTFHANTAGRQGGGVWIYINGHGRVLNSTFEANSTTAPFNQVGQGGAMVVTLGLIDITNSTFANNHAAYQAGALHGGGSGDPRRVITLTNTIFLDNTLNEQDLPSETRWQGYHTNRPMADGGQNIQHPRLKPTYNNDVNNNITANPIYADPLLLALADNGGPSMTMALQPASPAVNAGASGCPATDQRGELRHGPCDIGAFEYLPDRLVLSPSLAAIPPGGSVSFEVQVLAGGGDTSPFTLSVTNPYPHLSVQLNPQQVAPGQTATLTVTDAHGGASLLPGLWHDLPLTAVRGSQTISGEARLLVGGQTLALPVVMR